MIAPAKHKAAHPLHQRGVSLVELMVALVTGLLVVAAVTALTINTSRTNNELSKFSRQVENGRYAMQLLHDELNHAGFFGRFHDAGDPPASLPDPCSVALADLQNGLTLPVQAHTATTNLACLATADHVAGTEILVIRRAVTEPTLDFATVTTCPAGDTAYDALFQDPYIYIQPQPKRVVIKAAPATGVLGAGEFDLTERDYVNNRSDCPTPIHLYRTDIYYVSPTTTASSPCPGTVSGTAQNVPTLTRLRRDLTGIWCGEPLVEGIQNLQYDFGIDSSGDGVPDGGYVRTPANTGEWSSVMAVRINLLARNHDGSLEFTDEKTYSMSEDGTLVLGPFNDNIRRRLFAGLVRLTNPASRRESD